MVCLLSLAVVQIYNPHFSSQTARRYLYFSLKLSKVVICISVNSMKSEMFKLSYCL